MDSLADRILEFANRWETHALVVLARELSRSPSERPEATNRYVAELSPAGLRDDLLELMDRWRSDHQEVSAKDFALMLRCCARTHERLRGESTTELVWTGPFPKGASLRRTEQALIQLIDESTEEIWLASYAFSPFEQLVTSLGRAHDRGVRINFLLEVAIDSGKAGVNDATIERLKRDFGATVYTWNLAKREGIYTNRLGVLHCKFALIDGSSLLITSANLTDAAMVANMELGVIMTHSKSVARLSWQVTALIASGDLVLRT